MKETILITGATKGLGRQCATFLSSKGYRVFGTGRSVGFGEKLDNFTLIPCDIEKQESVDKAIQYLIETEGRIDILINNAGRGMIGAAEDATIDESKQLFNLNFHGIERMCKAVLPQMRKSKKGKIINISSLAGLMGLPLRAHYCASKYAVEGWTESMRMEVKKFGIHVSLVAPGDFKSDISASRIICQKSRNSVYKNDFEKISNKIDEEVDAGPDPQLIVDTIYKVIKSKNPKLRYKAASTFQKFATHLHYILPSRVFEKIMMKTYDL